MRSVRARLLIAWNYSMRLAGAAPFQPSRRGACEAPRVPSFAPPRAPPAQGHTGRTAQCRGAHLLEGAHVVEARLLERRRELVDAVARRLEGEVALVRAERDGLLAVEVGELLAQRLALAVKGARRELRRSHLPSIREESARRRAEGAQRREQAREGAQRRARACEGGRRRAKAPGVSPAAVRTWPLTYATSCGSRAL